MARKSIGTRIGLMLGVVAVGLVVTLSSAYVWTQRNAVIEAEVHAARNLILMTESVRQSMENKWDLGLFSAPILMDVVRDPNLSPAEKKERVLAAVPVVTAWQSAKAKAREGGFEFRTPRHNPRNLDNAPDAIEEKALAFFKANRDATEYHVIDSERNSVRYFRPVRLAKTCLACHGQPERAVDLWDRDDGHDITGNKMDGKKVGDLHGAFEVIRSLDEADAQLRIHLIEGILIVLVIIGIGVFLIVRFMNRLVTAPIGVAADELHQIAEGDLRGQQEEHKRDDEIGDLIAESHAMRSHLRTTVGAIRVAAQNVASASAEISSASSDLSDRTQSQAANLEETTSNLEQLGDTVRGTANNAEQTRKIAETAISKATDSTFIAENALKAMTQIEGVGGEMSEIIDVINEIAFQTNLLALNASVEAARAGDAGRGFAVVAQEIQKLAHRAANSANDVKTLIDNSAKDIASGSTQVRETVEALGSLVESFLEVTRIVGEVSTATQEQAAGINEISQAMMDLDTNINKDAALVEETSASARSLEEQSVQLMHQVSFFDINER